MNALLNVIHNGLLYMEAPGMKMMVKWLKRLPKLTLLGLAVLLASTGVPMEVISLVKIIH